MNRTSITDEREYVDFCYEAAINNEKFASFRKAPIYVKTLEHVSYESGLQYIDKIKNCEKNFLDKLDEFKKNDKLGNPELFDYEKPFGKISSTTVRYIATLCDINEKLGSLNNKSIVEIGVGYGGQCSIINKAFDVKSYKLIDLTNCILLAMHYLSELGVKADYQSYDKFSENEQAVSCDVVISNYAFSGCTREVQKQYFDKVISKAKHGYLLCNFISPIFGLKSFSLHELINMFVELGHEFYFIDEDPLTYKGNTLIYWR